eukprot:m.29334 g.29334  ORF g.29334 m.29334 type:complete len:375 (+) comp6671_c0_seq2:84-1208(+)
MKGQCVVLVLSGLPGAGKSTLAKALFEASLIPANTPKQPSEDEVFPSVRDHKEGVSTAVAAGVEFSCTILCYDDNIQDPARTTMVAEHLRSQARGTDTPATQEARGAQASLPSVAKDTRDTQNSDGDFKQSRRRLLDEIARWLEVNSEHGSAVSAPQSSEEQAALPLNVLVVDDNMYFTSMRYSVYQVVRKYRAGFATMVLQCGLAVALQRNTRREHVVLPEVVERMSRKLEVPRPDKNLWEKHTEVVPGTAEVRSTVCKALELCHRAALDPTTPCAVADKEGAESDRKATADSITHQFDMASRRMLATAVTQLLADNKKSRIAAINTVRKDAVKEAKGKVAAGVSLDDLVHQFQLRLDVFVGVVESNDSTQQV